MHLCPQLLKTIYSLCVHSYSNHLEGEAANEAKANVHTPLSTTAPLLTTPLSPTMLCCYTSFSYTTLLLHLFLLQCSVAAPLSPTLLCCYNSFYSTVAAPLSTTLLCCHTALLYVRYEPPLLP